MKFEGGASFAAMLEQIAGLGGTAVEDGPDHGRSIFGQPLEPFTTMPTGDTILDPMFGVVSRDDSGSWPRFSSIEGTPMELLEALVDNTTGDAAQIIAPPDRPLKEPTERRNERIRGVFLSTAIATKLWKLWFEAKSGHEFPMAVLSEIPKDLDRMAGSPFEQALEQLAASAERTRQNIAQLDGKLVDGPQVIHRIDLVETFLHLPLGHWDGLWREMFSEGSLTMVDLFGGAGGKSRAPSW